MAISVSQRVNRPTRKSWAVTATSQGDTTFGFAHGMGAEPNFDPLLLKVTMQAIQPAGREAGWIVLNVDPSTITIQKSTAVGSGTGPPQAMCYAELPHTLT